MDIARDEQATSMIKTSHLNEYLSIMILDATRSRSTDLALRNRTSAQQLPPTTPKDAFRSPEKSAESKRRKKSKRRSSKSERAGPMVQKEADFERRIMKELIAEVIEQSITEVTNEEERHHVAVAMSPQLTVAVA